MNQKIYEDITEWTKSITSFKKENTQKDQEIDENTPKDNTSTPWVCCQVPQVC